MRTCTRLCMVALATLAPAKQLKSAATITASDAPGALAAEAHEDFRATCNARALRAMDRPAVKAAMEELKAGILDHRELAQAGRQLLESLRKSPEIAASAAAFKEQLAQSPSLKQIVRDAMVENGDTHRVSATISKRWERNRQGEAWKKCLDDAVDKFKSRPLTIAAIESLATNGDVRFMDAICDHLTARAADPKLMARLTELNGGKTPGPEALQDLLLKHVATEERWETFAVQFLQMSLVKKELAGVFVAMLESDEFRTIIASRLAKIMADAQFQRLAVNLMDVLLRDNPTAAQFERVLKPFIALPVLNESTIGILLDMKKCKDVNEASGKAFESVLKSDEFKNAIESAFLSNL